MKKVRHGGGCEGSIGSRSPLVFRVYLHGCLLTAFVHQGMLTLVSNCIDRLNVYNSAAHFGECAGSEAGAAWKDILNLLYELLGEPGPPKPSLTVEPRAVGSRRSQSVPMRFTFR